MTSRERGLERARALIKARLKLTDAAQIMGIDASKLSKILSGERQARPLEVSKLAAYLRIPDLELMEMLGTRPLATYGTTAVVSGQVGDDDVVRLYPQGFVPYQVSAASFGFETLVEVAGSGLSPRFIKGEVLAFAQAEMGKEIFPKDVIAPWGEAVVMMESGEMLLKRVVPLEKPGILYSLISLNPLIPPMIDVRLEWCSNVVWHIPGLPYAPFSRGPLDDTDNE